MSLSLYRVPNGQQKGQSFWPCPFVYSPASALGSLSSVALSSAPVILTLTREQWRAQNRPGHCNSGGHFFVRQRFSLRGHFYVRQQGPFKRSHGLDCCPGYCAAKDHHSGNHFHVQLRL